MEGQQITAADRISELPVEILHAILNQLDSPKQAARASTLSKRWRDHVWPSYPLMEFRHSEFGVYGLSHRFRRFAAAARKRMPQLAALRISLPSYDAFPSQPAWANDLTKLLETMSSSKLLEIALQIEETPWKKRFVWPRGMVLKPRTQVLRLRGFSLQGYPEVLLAVTPLDGLRVLSLEQVLVQESVLDNLLANAPNLESLTLDLVLPGIKKLEVSSSNIPNLKILAIRGQDSVGKVKLTAAHQLESLDIEHWCELEVVSSSSSAPVLRAVRIFDVEGFTQEELDDFVSKLPALESLSFRRPALAKCRSRMSSKVRISGAYKLRELQLTDFLRPNDPLEELEIIDAPNLVSLHYLINNTCSTTKLPGRTNVVNVRSDCRFIVDLRRIDRLISHGWFFEIRKFLKTLTMNNRQLKLALKLNSMDDHHLLSKEPLDFNEAGYNFPPVEFEHLQLEANEEN